MATIARPIGHTDRAGRWYPSPAEHASCCDRIRTPSRAWPWSLYRHALTAHHARIRAAEHAAS